MATAWNDFQNEPSPASNKRHQESFEQHVERMKMFQKSHGPIKPSKQPRAPDDITHAKAEEVLPELHELMPALIITGYVLELVQECGTVMLPRNWQN